MKIRLKLLNVQFLCRHSTNEIFKAIENLHRVNKFEISPEKGTNI